MVFAAGRGERLGALTGNRAKPALDFLGVPLLTRVLSWLAASGIREVMVNLHHCPGSIEPLLRAAERGASPLRILRSPERRLLGTSGGLSRALERFGPPAPGSGPLLVLNGDTLPTLDLEDMVRFHGAAGGAATLLGDPDPGPAFAGERRLEADPSGRITGLGAPGSRGFAFAGMWLLEAAALRWLRGGPGGLLGDLLRGLIAGGDGSVFSSRAPWFEIGTPRRYLEASLAALAGGAPAPSPRTGVRLGAGAAAAPPELVGDGSVLEAGARVDRSLLLEGVRVGSRARVRRSVVAPGETVPPGAVVEDSFFAGGRGGPL